MDQKGAQNELEFIKKIMTDSRQVFVDNGLGLIVWGLLIVTGIALHYTLSMLHVRFSASILWGIVAGIGWIFSIIYGIRERRRRRYGTFAGKMIRSIWIACGIALMVIGFFSSPRIDYRILPAFFASIMAIGMFICGIIIGRPVITMTAFGWWLGGVAMFMFPSKFNFMYFGFLMILLGIIPGISLYIRWRKESRQPQP